MTPPYKLDDAGHALDRFIERHVKEDPRNPVIRSDAEWALLGIVRSAVHVEDVADEGQEIWRGVGGWADVKLVVKDGVVRTVLPLGAKRPEGRR